MKKWEVIKLEGELLQAGSDIYPKRFSIKSKVGDKTVTYSGGLNGSIFVKYKGREVRFSTEQLIRCACNQIDQAVSQRQGGALYKCQEGKEGEGMKYIVFWEYDKKDKAAVLQKFKTKPEAEITRLALPYALGGQTRGFSLFEDEDFERIEKFQHRYAPLLKLEIFPIIEVTKLVEIRKY